MLKNGIKTAHNKSLKRSYKSLTPKEYRVMKMIERRDAAEKFLYGYKGFYATAPRLFNRQVDWSKVDENTISIFEKCNRDIQAFNRIDDELVRTVTFKFCSSQFSYSQSF